jgi:hypothetical protein
VKGSDPTADADADPEADPDSDSGRAAETDVDTGAEADQCAEPDCARPAAVRVHVPWAADRAVCPAHGRALSAQDGVVAVPLDPDGGAAEWP